MDKIMILGAGEHQLHLIDPQEKQAYLQHLCRLHPAFLPKDSTPEELQLLISRYKNGLLCRQEWAAELAGAYDAFLEGRNQLDFDDMILRCRKLLTDKPEALYLWRQRFKWILVDEFQDVSPAQYDVLCLLAAPANNLFVVGDDDQSIYGFRGADPGIMRRFLKDFKADTGNGEKVGSRQAFFDGTLRGTGENPPGARVIFLSANYRCGRRFPDPLQYISDRQGSPGGIRSARPFFVPSLFRPRPPVQLHRRRTSTYDACRPEKKCRDIPHAQCSRAVSADSC